MIPPAVGECDDAGSQLTSSSVEDGDDDDMNDDDNNKVVVDDIDDDDDYDEDSDPTAHMTELQKAERAIMLDLIMGKKNNSKSSVGLLPTAQQPSSSITTTTGVATRHDPVQQKIDELMRKSLDNVKKGAHPLQVSTTGGPADDDSDDTPFSNSWNDDMAIDPSIYHNPNRRDHQQQSSSNSMMMTDNDNDNNIGGSAQAATSSSVMSFPHLAPLGQRQRKRSNSISNVRMDMDDSITPTTNNNDTNFGNPYQAGMMMTMPASSSTPTSNIAPPGVPPICGNVNARASSSTDMDMES
jgi:hypothetical protein